jgi:uncharacterized repeat protein (TIGR03803 family)
MGNLIADKQGNLYGTTQYGGRSNKCGVALGCGAAYELEPSGKEFLLYPFCSQTDCSDGALPQAGLTFDGTENLVGTTFGVDQAPGKLNCSKGCGNTYGYSLKTGEENVIYSFNGAKGAEPASPLLRRGHDFYGTTYSGGRYGGGTLYKITQAGKVVVLHDFGKGSDGYYPYGPLFADQSNNIYGTTVEGGVGHGGTVFEYAHDDSYTILYSFCSQASCADGMYPFGGVIVDSKGNFYGTTQYGGAHCAQPYGCGTVFKLSSSGSETVLHTFAGGPADGAYPFSSLLMDKSGDLYGTTQNGGNGSGCAGACGTVFEFAAGGSETILHSFDRGTGGAWPRGGLLELKGYLYGTASGGGTGNGEDGGIVYMLNE